MGTGPAVAALDRPRVDEGWQATLSETWPVVLATALLWAVPIAFGVRAVWRDRGARRFVLASVLVPIAAVLLLFPFFPLVHEKYLIFLWPFLLLLAVVGARSARGFAKPALLAGLVLLHAVGLVAYHGVQARPVVDLLSEGHAYGKEQWFEAHRWISNRAREGDVVLVHCRLEAVGGPGRTTPIVEPVWSYYDRERSPRLVPLFLPETAMSAEEFGKKFGFLSEARAVFLVLSHEETEPKDAWARTLHEFFFGAWGGFESEREDFPRSWGIRVWRFARGA